MPKPKPRVFLALRKAITGKRATPVELGYQRDPKTGRLTKPGALKVNAAIEKINKDYRELDYNEAQRKKVVKPHNKKIMSAEIKRKADLRRRQLENWIEKLNKGLRELGGRRNVEEIKDEYFKNIFGQEIKARKRDIKSNPVLFESRLKDKFNSIFYSELHSMIQKTGPEKLRDISYLDATKLLNIVSIKVQTQRNNILIDLRKLEMGIK